MNTHHDIGVEHGARLMKPPRRIARPQHVADIIVGPFIGISTGTGFLDIARLQEPNPLLYRLFPLTCARSQE
jgi:hypothetical protein